MKFWQQRTDLALYRDDTTRALPWMLALKVYFAVLALAALIALQTAVSRWQGGAYAVITAELPATTSQGQMAEAMALLEGTPGVTGVAPLTDADVMALLSPWLGPSDLGGDLPLPRLIDVQHDPAVAVDWQHAESQLAGAFPGAAIDTGMTWINRLTELARSVQLVAAAMLILVVAVTIVAISFAARAGLAIHRSTIELLHLLGAEDRYIASQFQRHTLGFVMRGALIGLIFAVLTLLLIGIAAARLDAPLLPSLELQALGWTSLIILPFLITLIALVTARLTVLRALARMP